MKRYLPNLGYVVAILAPTLGLLFSLAIIETPVGSAQPLLFLVAVAVATWFGGLGPGLVATSLGVCYASFFSLPPVATSRAAYLAVLLNIGLLAVLGIAISLLGKTSHVLRGSAVVQQACSQKLSPPQMLWTTRPDGFSGYRLWFNEHWYEVPALTAPDQRHDAGASEQRAANAEGVPYHNVLVVDDSQDAAETLSWVLQSLGQHVTSIVESDAVLEWMLLERPDIVFLDIGMPGLNGYEVARRIRQNKNLADTVLVALTCFDRQEDRTRAIEAGFNCHLAKPTTIATLTDLLLAIPTRRSNIELTTCRYSTLDAVRQPTNQSFSTESQSFTEPTR